MQTPKHSPGPWNVNANGQIVSSDAQIVATLNVSLRPLTSQEIAANAYVLAAAPNLLRHLKNLAHYFDGLEGPFSDHKREILDLIALAETGKK